MKKLEGKSEIISFRNPPIIMEPNIVFVVPHLFDHPIIRPTDFEIIYTARKPCKTSLIFDDRMNELRIVNMSTSF